MIKSLFIFLTSISFSVVALADDNGKTVGQKVESGVEKTQSATKEAYNDSKDAVKKGYRDAKDKTCEMINGKLECAAKKVGNGVRNAADKVGDKVDDVKN